MDEMRRRREGGRVEGAKEKGHEGEALQQLELISQGATERSRKLLLNPLEPC